MNESEHPKTPMTAEEVRSRIEELARSGEGADQRWALRMLSAQESAAVTLPTPLTDDEMVERGIRQNHAMGYKIATISYRKAWARYKTDIPPRLSLDDLPPALKEEAKKMTSVKMLYRRWPAFKRPGIPKGYPNQGTALEKQEWCQHTAATMLLAEEQKQLDDDGSPPDPTASEPPCPSS